MDTIKQVTGISCTKNIMTAEKGDYIKVNGRVALVLNRYGYRGRKGYVVWSLGWGNNESSVIYSDTLENEVFEKPTSMEALMLRTKMLVSGQMLS